MVTIQDVAKAAGVSPMTVSHVINEQPNVRASTRERVLEAIAALDYRVNHTARNLRKGRTGTIALAVPEVDRPYFAQLSAALLDAAKRRDLRVAIEQTGGSREGELDALALSRTRFYDGLLLSAVGLSSADSDLLRVEFPVVILGERIFAGPVDHVAMPNAEAAQAATAHLIERGSRRIAMVGGLLASQVEMATLRTDGYRAALADAGIAFDPDLVKVMPAYTMEEAVRVAHALVDDGVAFDGAFCITDTVAIGFLRGLADRGVRVPEQVRVIGFDGIAETAYTVPSLSTIDPDTTAMAERAVELLVHRIERRDDAPGDFVGSFRVRQRGSTA